MKVSLIFPPQWQPYQPNSGIAYIKSFLSKKGYDVFNLDANILLYNNLFQKDNIIKLAKKRNYKFSKSELRILDLIKYRIKVLKTKNFYELKKLFSSLDFINNYLMVFSKMYTHFSLSLDSCKFFYSNEKYNEILDSLEDLDSNPYIDLCELFLKPEYINNDIDVFGISIISHTQIIPGLTIAKKLKSWFPKCKIIIGGGVFSKLDLNLLPPEFNFVDVIIKYEGELVIDYVLQSVLSEEKLKKIPNIGYWSNSQKKFIANSTLQINKLNREFIASIPDFSDMNKSSYLLPENIFPVLISRGCYWNKCSFCDHSFIYGNKFSINTPEDAVHIVKKLKDLYSIDLFYFVDEAIPLNFLMKFAEILIEQKIKIKYYCLIRADKFNSEKINFNLLRESGLLMVSIGLESASSKILNNMNKNIDVENAEVLLNKLYNANIFIGLFLLFKYPGESIEDALETIEFIKKNNKYIGALYISEFVLMKDSPIFDKIKETNKTLKLTKDIPHGIDFVYDTYDFDTFINRELNNNVNINILNSFKLNTNFLLLYLNYFENAEYSINNKEMNRKFHFIK